MTAEDTASNPPQMPPVLGGVAPYLTLSNATAGAEFYVKAFGAAIVGSMPPDDKGRTMHIHLHVNGGSLMLSDAYPEQGHPLQPPQGYTLHLQVDDVDAWWNRAVEAGCTPTMPFEIAFWGDRYGQLVDPFVVKWSIGETVAAA